jgi:hypothetical protein
MGAVPLFCRHNRFEHNCPICSKEKAAAARPARAKPTRAGTARRSTSGSRTTGVVTRKLARAADDGYRHDLVPGIKATADAERLAACLALAVERLEYPGPYPAVAEESERSIEDATWLAFLLALAGPDRPELQEAVIAARPAFGESGLDPDADRTITAYAAWARRSGSQEAAINGDNAWSPERRFARAFERLAVPGFHRAQRYDFLTALGAAAVYELEADALHPGENDAATVAAKRALIAGDMMFLERRAKALAEGTGVPIAALDRGLALWDSTAELEAPETETRDRVREALGLA